MKVSVKMITYNHEKYIHQAIDSVLMQETDFPYELVIGEDCSTDGTREIAVDYQRRYPNKIRLLLSERNLGMHENSKRTREACQGEYVAMLEGDDYWISPAKLQKQVDFLDSHADCVLCFHNVTKVHNGVGDDPVEVCPSDQKEISTLEDLLVTCFIPTVSVMYRQGVVSEFPDWYSYLAMADWPFFLLCAEHGNIGYIREILGAYRVHSTGVWSGMRYEEQLRELFRMYEAVNAHLVFKYDRTITMAKSDHVARLLVERIKSTPSLEEGTALALQTLEEWADLEIPEDWKAKAMGRVYAYYLFSSHAEGNRPLGRRSFARLVRSDPSWLRNPGVWSIAVDAYCGRALAGLLRKLTRGMLRLPEAQTPNGCEYAGIAEGG